MHSPSNTLTLHSINLLISVRELYPVTTVGWWDQLLGDWRIVARGLNSASTHVSKGVPGVWSQACGVLLSVIGCRSY